MEKNTNSFYILHMSDFHISKKKVIKEDAKKALRKIADVIKNEEKIEISYLIHTGDIIDSSDLKEEIKRKCQKKLKRNEITDEEYDKYLEDLVEERFGCAEEIIKEFVEELDILKKNIIVCCGNHDTVHYKSKEKNRFKLFQQFLEKISLNQELTSVTELDDLNVLVLNTNNRNIDAKKKEEGRKSNKTVACINCKDVTNKLKENKEKEVKNTKWFYSSERQVTYSDNAQKLNIIVAHQPLYDICEHARLPYEAQIQTTDFLSELQEFINGKGIYLCGDKHTSSIAASYIHDIPHYFCGQPFSIKENKIPEECFLRDEETSNQSKGKKKLSKKEIDYNLIEVVDGKVGQIRKFHLLKNNNEWKCEIRPIDTVVAKLYEKSKKYIVRNSFEYLAVQNGDLLTSLSWNRIFEYMDALAHDSKKMNNISEFYKLFCRLKKQKVESEYQETPNIFEELNRIIEESMKIKKCLGMENIINIRGEYGSGKSTFLGFLYIYLLYCYSCGKIKYIPAYFNLENNDILNRIQDGNTYALSVKQTFYNFVKEIETIAEIEHTSVCYIIDGLDEQDIWSESSQDSVGRVILDILAETNNFKYIMSFSQNKLGRFKNTMPAMKYYEKSCVMYFKSIEVEEKSLTVGGRKEKFSRFIRYILEMYEGNSKRESDECEAIRKLRRLSVDLGFMYYNYEYLKEYSEKDSIEDMYKKYIDQQHKICQDFLEYGFVHYAPAIAYLFSYEGYTYEKFKNIAPDTPIYLEQRILENSKNLYKTFIFIKKNKDAREYLLALHYNRELRYFAENLNSEIPENSILNKLLPRNISIIIKKMWETDQNKFIIVCEKLIERCKKKKLSKCTLSMLIYILSYLNDITVYSRDKVTEQLKNLDDLNNSEKKLKEIWKIEGDSLQRIQKFMDLNLLHSEKILDAINKSDSNTLVRELLSSPEFRLYNRQYMMWYYGDLTIYGENGMNNLVPGEDIINKGIDYYNCFYTLYHKIYGYFEIGCTYSYPLLELDLFTIVDLIYTRRTYKLEHNVILESAEERENQICNDTSNILKHYLEKKNLGEEMEKFVSEFQTCGNQKKIEQIKTFLDQKVGENDERYVYLFFRLMKKISNT